ncbi:ABC transporter permease [Hwanghaeella grinnelliae]|uniref:ABC transporter permease n=1 Tax=Hwanghaeella grinnelliae TaxID=2500179 RepID=A0A3S2WVU9_9PROT|nr:ABC transporter permease [Hwanghaeella grinnelliae]RVU39674.1 ABC transporter permease [Hwanghaeella grinnelliae]
MATPSIEDVIGQSQHHGWLARVTSRQTFWIFLAAIIACVLLSLVTDTFATERNLFNVTRNFAFVGIIALGMTTVIASGGIDLSVGSSVVLSAIVVGTTMAAGFPIYVAVPLAIGAALCVGLLNGVLIAYAQMPPFVVTLGTLAVARSLAMVLSGNKMIYEFGPDHDLLLGLGGGSMVGIANPVYFLMILAVLTGLSYRWTRWGQHVFAVGGNETAAGMTGIRVARVKVSVYMFSAFTAGVTGVLEVGWLGGVTTNLGQSMELTVIAAAVIGGATLAGGSGTALGAVVGAALIEVIRNSLILLGISTFWQGTFVGSFIIIAVAIERMRSLRQNA